MRSSLARKERKRKRKKKLWWVPPGHYVLFPLHSFVPSWFSSSSYRWSRPNLVSTAPKATWHNPVQTFLRRIASLSLWKLTRRNVIGLDITRDSCAWFSILWAFLHPLRQKTKSSIIGHTYLYHQKNLSCKDRITYIAPIIINCNEREVVKYIIESV